MDDGRRTTTTESGHRAITIAHPEHVVLRWAKKGQCQPKVISFFKLYWAQVSNAVFQADWPFGSGEEDF